MLHIFSADKNRTLLLEQCTRALVERDVLLLTGAALALLADPGALRSLVAKVKKSSARLCVLERGDGEADRSRIDQDRVGDGIRFISMGDFVALASKHTQSQTWF